MNNKNPLISVVVPVYNVEKYLHRCITSILRQTYTNLEVILVDDGSLDNSPYICDEFAKKDKRVLVIHKENGGLSSARNAGLDMCHGAYIGFVDSDDYIAQDMYQNLLSVVQNENNIIGVTLVAVESENGNIQHINNMNVLEETKEQYIESLLLHTGDVSAWSKLFPRDIIGTHRFDETKLNEDLLFIFSIEKDFKKFKYTSSVGYHYIVHKNSTSRIFGKSIHDMVVNAKTIRQYVDCNYSKYKIQAERFEIFQNIAFLWSVPIGYNRNEDILCKTTEAFIKKNFWHGMMNPYLTQKDKIRLIILSIFPTVGPTIYKFLRQK